MKIEDIKRDREAGTPGEWSIEDGANSHIFDARIISDVGCVAFAAGECVPDLPDVPDCPDGVFEPSADARRIARVPELEAAFLEAVGLLSEVAEGMDRATHDDVLEFLERFK